MSFQSILIRFARSIVESVIGQITDQINNLTEMVQSPIREMIGLVTGGIWRGRGADKFVDEMNSVVLPMVGQLIAAILGLNTSVRTCITTLDRADEEARNVVNSVSDIFDAVYK
jgi:phage-related protein